jgi:hypothetical protein
MSSNRWNLERATNIEVEKFTKSLNSRAFLID